MKAAHIAILLASTAFVSACALTTPNEGVSRRVSADYTAKGAAEGTRAYVYGNRTVLEFDGASAFLSVKDETGASVDYEREGRYYRLTRRLDNFTASINGRLVTFSPATMTHVFSAPAPIKATAEPVNASVVEPAPASQADVDMVALLKLSEKQLVEVRKAIEAAGKNPKATGAELLAVNAHMDEIEARLVTAAAAIVQVTFPTGSTAFKPSLDVATVLVASARAADRVTVRGRTDSRVAGPINAKIALGRALAARKFLVDNGVQAEKIKVFSQAGGGFVAPNITTEGKALNRRVEIEFVNARIAELKGQTVKLAAIKIK